MDGDSSNTSPTTGSNATLASFVCPSCGAAVPIRAVGITVTAICPACGSISDSENGDFKLVKKAVNKLTIDPLIPLGTKGKLRGQVFQVIGFMRRYEKLYIAEPWDEYLLFNPYTGYRWLSTYKGHWTLYKTTQNRPDHGFGRSFNFLGKTFQDFHSGSASVQFVIGEFYWKVRVGDTVDTLDAISPPFILSREKSPGEEVWSLGEYIEPSEINSAFHPKVMPSREGVAPNQPTAYTDANTVWMTWFLILVAMMFVQMFGSSVRKSKSIQSPSVYVYPAGITDAPLVDFTTYESSTPVTIELSTVLNQTWANITLRVVSDDPAKGNVATFEKDFSHYSGVDDGEAWSEGSEVEEFLLNRLPRGTYHVLVSATPEPGHSSSIVAYVTTAPTVWSNFWLALLLISIPPFWMSFRSRNFEVQRWSESEFNPYESSETSS